MVSKKRDAAASRERLLAAAAAEFAARGFAGAKVDRIAARARLNKAMIYYHFHSKAALYREVLVDVFRTIAEAVASTAPTGDPDVRLRQFIRTVAGVLTTRPHFAPIWLREMAEGGRHVDAAILQQLRAVLVELQQIIGQGHAAGRFARVHPLIVQLGIVGPIVMFFASAPARARLARHAGDLASVDYDALLQHVEAAALGGLAASRPSSRPSSRRPS